ncbi:MULTISPECIES: hypothetical protein [Streptomyces]|uniref:hypothetical protein n=1 Tax=Streptomyces TaxID=1883 RepID=UPI00224990A3|nr:hypothetical protein [Streptomyces sp. JHD 1]MCX2971544.1 hypothetical protein [Streptomyces sp. JHD 1]
MKRFGVAVVLLTALTALTACGGDGGDGRARESPEAGPAGGAPAAAPLAVSGQRLEQAAFAEGERVGDGEVGTFPLDGPSYDELEFRARPEVCQPLVSLAPGATGTDPGATVDRRVTFGDDFASPSVDVQLRSYPDGDAERVMRALGEAGAACADGFTEDRALAEAAVRSVAAAEVPAGAGDEAVAFRLEVRDVKDEEIVFMEYLTVVRAGTVTAAFRAERLPPGDPGPVPETIVTEQLDRLATA